jgi:uncharacterized protein (TIGR00255 family)
MIRGMTGFGRVSFIKSRVKGFVELRSLNHKYFDVSFHLPNGFGSFEERLKRVLHKEIMRGKVNVSLVFTCRPEDKIAVRKDIAGNYLKSFKTLNKSLRLKSDLGLSNVVTLPGVIRCEEYQVASEEIWPQVERAAKVALAGLVRMRQEEGKTLCRDVADKINRIQQELKLIVRRVKQINTAKKTTLAGEEFSAFLKSSDINEELTRLGHHLQSLKGKLNGPGGVGKELDFIAQELQREINTISAKLLDHAASTSVIKIKSLVEKIREQLQNVE